MGGTLKVVSIDKDIRYEFCSKYDKRMYIYRIYVEGSLGREGAPQYNRSLGKQDRRTQPRGGKGK